MQVRRIPLVLGVVLGACRDAADPTPRPADRCTLSGVPVAELRPGTTTRVVVSAVCDGPNAVVDLRFASSDTTVVRVDSLTGEAFGVRQGDVAVTARLAAAPGHLVSVPMHVTDGCLTGDELFTLSPANAAMTIGAHVTFVATHRVGCQRPDSQATFTSSDPNVATVDSAGVAVGRRFGNTTITAVSRRNPNLRASAPLSVLIIGGLEGFTVSPSTLTLAPLDTARLTVALTLAPGAPAGTSRGVTFRSRDSCVVAVDSTGLVTALRPGAQGTVLVASAAFPTIAQLVSVTTLMPRVPQPVFFRDLLTGTPPRAADLSSLGGTVTAVVSVYRAELAGTGHVELWLAGRLAASAPLPPIRPGQTFVELALTIDTSLRDAANQRVYPNGQTDLEARLVADGQPTVPGCSAQAAGLVVTRPQTVILANP